MVKSPKVPLPYQSYRQQTLRPLNCLIFIAPLLVMFHIGLACYGTDLMIPYYLHVVLRYLGAPGVHLPGLLIVMVLFGQYFLRRDKWRLEVRVFAGMLVESIAWGLPLIALSFVLPDVPAELTATAPAAPGRHEPQPAGTIKAGKPTYEPRTGEYWRQRGRILGDLRDAPACEIYVLDSSGRVVKSTRVSKGDKAYALQWLKPGVHALRVEAAGYQTLELKNLEVRARHDLFVNLEFTAGLFERVTAAVGSGIYEEFFFRLVFISLVMLIFVDVFALKEVIVASAAVILAAIAFSFCHVPVEQLTGKVDLNWNKVIFLFGAGLLWGVVFVFRGLGIAVGSHIFYNLYVLGVAQ